jgi:hypothetical protein
MRRSSMLVARVVRSPLATCSDPPECRVSRKPQNAIRYPATDSTATSTATARPICTTSIQSAVRPMWSRSERTALMRSGCRCASPVTRQPRPTRNKAVTAPDKVAGA